jgi:hypothetical protein
MAKAIGNPGEDIENRVLVGGKNAGKVGAIENVLEGGQHSDPDVRSNLIGDKAGRNEHARRLRSCGA